MCFPSCKSKVGYWAIKLAISGAAVGSLLAGLLVAGDAEAGRGFRRQRARYECKQSNDIARSELDRARRYWESGMIYYDAKEYAKAHQEFLTAYEISKLPDFLINLAQTSSHMGKGPDAIKYLEDYVQECPGAPDAPMARQRIDELRIAQAIKEGEKPPPSPPLRLPPTPALVLLGAGAGFLIIGAGLGGGAIVASKEVGDASKHGLVFDTSLQSAERRGRALEGAAIGFDVIGGLTLLCGAAWVGAFYYQEKTGLQISLRPSPGGLALAGSF